MPFSNHGQRRVGGAKIYSLLFVRKNCSKFFDLSETDEKEVNEIKVKLHLNIAMCFLKMDNMQ